MQIIAAIDLWDGQVVRLWQGDFAQRETMGSSPEEVGERFLSWGIRRWHVVDLMGARQGQLQQQGLLERFRSRFPQVQLSIGGGLRTEAEVEWALRVGFDWVVLGSVAVSQPDTVRAWLERWGSERFILAADMRGKHLAVAGWQEITAMRAEDFLRQWQAVKPAAFLCTQVERDGTLQGPDLAGLAALQKVAAPVPVIASGGIRGPADLEALRKAGLSAAIVGKALYTDPSANEWAPKYASIF